MKFLAIIPLMAVGIATPVLAQQSKTVTIDTPRFEGERVIVRDRDTGTYDRNGNLIRKRDGASASSVYQRNRTENGRQASGSQTGFQGRTRSFDYERERTKRGYKANGTATTGNGNTYDFKASGRKTVNGYQRGRRVTDGNGNVVYKKRVNTRRVDGQVHKRVSVKRDSSFKPRQIKPLRPKTMRPRQR